MFSLTACPANVSLELSHDGQYVVPVAPPLATSSLALIKLQLVQPAVVSVVTLRLHRPRDSSTMGLQQICLQGMRACGHAETLSSGLPSDDSMTRCRFVIFYCIVFSWRLILLCACSILFLIIFHGWHRYAIFWKMLIDLNWYQKHDDCRWLRSM